jgi:hypothetical protein
VSLLVRNDGDASIISSQRPQESNDCLNLLLRQILIELGGGHFPNCLAEGLGAAVMKIRRCRGDIPQAWHAKYFGIWRGERMEDAVPLEEIAAHIHALMAGDAAERLE